MRPRRASTVRDARGNTLRIGDTVRVLKARGRPKGIIAIFYSDIAGGLRLDRKCADFYSWNALDVEKIGPNATHRLRRKSVP